MALRGIVGVRRVRPDEELSVVEHLDELRRRIIVAISSLIVGFVVAYVFHVPLFKFLAGPLPGDNTKLVTLAPTEGLFTVLKVCFWAALILALPLCLYQLYAFVLPAIAEQPRRRMLLVVAGVFVVTCASDVAKTSASVSRNSASGGSSDHSAKIPPS